MIRLGVPSKGRLMQDCLDWFGARGVVMRRTGSDREYSVAVEGIGGVVPVLLSAGEIPRDLATGRIHLGVTGSDLVREQLVEDEVAEIARLGFGQADLVLAVPNVWIDVETVDDLDAAASTGQLTGTIGCHLDKESAACAYANELLISTQTGRVQVTINEKLNICAQSSSESESGGT